MAERKHWKGPVTFTRSQDKRAFAVLSWLAKAASRDTTRYFMTGMFNELVDGKRVFVATDGRHLHKVEFPGREAMFAGVPVGKNLGFKADSKQFTFTEEIDRVFPNYKRVIPDIAGIEPFELWVRKTPEIGYTDALYTLYSKNIRMNALHVEAMALPDVPGWKAYYGCARDVVVCTQDIKGVLYTVVSAGLRI